MLKRLCHGSDQWGFGSLWMPGGEAQPALVVLPWDHKDGEGLQALLRAGLSHRGLGL